MNCSLTLDNMARGGIYDHLAALRGGNSDRRTAARALKKHFEKMLYDNALLASAYLRASRRRRPEYGREWAGLETMDYVLGRMTRPKAASIQPKRGQRGGRKK